MEAIYHEVGRVIFEAGSLEYEYRLEDHLGNTRSVFKDNGSGVAERIQKNDYYALGLAFEDDFKEYAYTFGNKEVQSELELDWLDFGARCYARDIGRWIHVDPLSEKYASVSPYTYTLNNPVFLIDPDGMRVSLFDRMEAIEAYYGKDTRKDSEEDKAPAIGNWTTTVSEEGIVTYTPGEGDNFQTFMGQYFVGQEKAEEIFKKSGLEAYLPQQETRQTKVFGLTIWEYDETVYKNFDTRTLKAKTKGLLKLRSSRDESRANHLQSVFDLADATNSQTINLGNYFGFPVTAWSGDTGFSFNGNFVIDGQKVPVSVSISSMRGSMTIDRASGFIDWGYSSSGHGDSHTRRSLNRYFWYPSNSNSSRSPAMSVSIINDGTYIQLFDRYGNPE